MFTTLVPPSAQDAEAEVAAQPAAPAVAAPPPVDGLALTSALMQLVHKGLGTAPAAAAGGGVRLALASPLGPEKDVSLTVLR